jgi:glucose/arabinose dehydrogenase
MEQPAYRRSPSTAPSGQAVHIREVRVGPDGAVYVLADNGGTAISDNTPPASRLLRLTPQ